MDDINFDELDKAVNSALKQAPKSDSPKEGVVADLPADSSNFQAEQTEAPQKPAERAAPKRRGQFMDMIHPSSDMVKQAPIRASRQGATIQPLSPSIVEAKDDDTVKPEAPVEEAQTVMPEQASVEPGSMAVSEVEQPARSEWPDPLDAMAQADESNEEHMTGVEAMHTGESSAEQPSDTPEKDGNPEEPQEAATSPFINGPELEKRPLGAFTDATSAEEAPVVNNAEPKEGEEAVAQENAEANDLPGVPQVPNELAPEVVSVESDDPARVAEVESDDDKNAEPSEGTGMAASISQQYKNTDEPSDGQDHPVFDTKDYHQPLTPPAKHGHTGLVVTLVILLLGLLGAGAWYAIFVLKLI